MAGGNIARRASEQAAKNVGAVRPTDINLTGVGGAAFDPRTGEVDFTSDPRQAQNLQMLQALTAAQGAGAGGAVPDVTRFAGQAADTSSQLLQEAGGFDPLAAAEERFSRLRGVLERGRDDQRASTEERLFRQGRLDSTGRGQGASVIGELESGFAREDALALDRQFQQAEQARQAALSGGLQAGAAGTTAQQSLFQQTLQGIPVQEQVATAPVRAALASQSLASNEAARRAAASSALSGHNQVVAANGSGGGGFASALGGIAGAGIGGYLTAGSPAGISAGATLGSNLGSFL